MERKRKDTPSMGSGSRSKEAANDPLQEARSASIYVGGFMEFEKRGVSRNFVLLDRQPPFSYI